MNKIPFHTKLLFIAIPLLLFATRRIHQLSDLRDLLILIATYLIIVALPILFAYKSVKNLLSHHSQPTTTPPKPKSVPNIIKVIIALPLSVFLLVFFTLNLAFHPQFDYRPIIFTNLSDLPSSQEHLIILSQFAVTILALVQLFKPRILTSTISILITTATYSLTTGGTGFGLNTEARHGSPLPFYTSGFSDVGGLHYYQISYPHLLLNLLFWYLTTSAIYSIFTKIKTRLQAKPFSQIPPHSP